MYFHSSDFSKYLSATIIATILLLAITPGFSMVAQAEETAETEEVVEEAVVEEPVVEEGAGDESDETVIETGDAVAETELENGVNINETQTGTTTEAVESVAEADPEEGETIASTTEPLVEEAPEDEEVATSTATTTPSNLDIEVSATNTATVLNQATTTAGTGGNVIEDASEAVIVTGDSYAAANVLNVVNLNVYDSSGLMLLLNNFFGFIGNLDLRQGDFGQQALDTCGGGCDGSAGQLKTTVTNDNVATISNEVVVRSGTGENEIAGAYGGLINTGDAYAAANVINVANTNITNSNYLLMVFNNFGFWGGDLIFPSATVFNDLANSTGDREVVDDPSDEGGSNEVVVTNDNEATINNQVETQANTGDNSATGDQAVIQTGSATAGTSVVNSVNQNVYGDTSVMLLIRVFGNWTGSVFNAPANISWAETPLGIQLYNNDGEVVDDASDLSDGAGANTTVVANTNVAGIDNNVSVYALTGENKIKDSAEAQISTGNAYAGSNIVNIANTNVYGSNWVLAIINIFGDWAGNISFGQPDLWVGSIASVSGAVTPGSEVTYNFTITNRGDADAHNVRLNGIFDKPFMRFDDDGVWVVGDIKAGESVEVSYKAQVEPETQMPPGETPIVSEITVTADEPDANRDDNKDKITVMAYNKRGVITTGMIANSDPVMELKKTASVTEITASSSVDYTITLNNYGNKAYEAVLIDQLENEAGEIISEQQWPLDTVYPNEEIGVTYTTNFSASTTPGRYTNYARVFAENGKSTIASSTIVVIGEVVTAEEEAPEPEVAGATIERDPPTKITKQVQPLYAPLEPVIYDKEPSNLFTRILMMATTLPQNPYLRMTGLALLATGLSVVAHRRRLEWRWGFRFTIF